MTVTMVATEPPELPGDWRADVPMYAVEFLDDYLHLPGWRERFLRTVPLDGGVAVRLTDGVVAVNRADVDRFVYAPRRERSRRR